MAVRKKYEGSVEFGANDPTLIQQNVKQYYLKQGIVPHGENDEQFQYLLDMYVNSPTHNAVCNGIIKWIFGQGLNIPDVIDTDDLLAIITDYYIFGNLSIQKAGDKISHIPTNYLRAQEVDEKGVVNNYFYSTDWNDNRITPQEIPSFAANPTAKRSVLFAKRYTPNAFYYGLPTFQGILNYCEVEINIGKYINYLIKNKFVVTKIINFNNGIPDDQTRKKITRDVKEKLTGVEGDPVVVAFNDSKDTAATIENVQIDNAQDQYSYVSTEAQSKIIIGHSVTSPLLIGVRDTNGFSSNSDEMRSAAALFQKQVIEPYQEWISGQLNYILGRNDIEFLPLETVLNSDNEVVDEVVVDETQMSEERNSWDELIELGESDLDGFELFDSEKVNYDTEDEILSVLDDVFKKEDTLMGKALNFISTGKASPSTKSEQDREEFAVRYRYRGSTSGERPFCNAMLNADKLYRKEDITNMRFRAVNPGFGEGGKNTYDIWLYKGGARCHHFWQREIYLRKDVSDKSRIELGRRISVAKARTLGTVETNNPKVAKHPNDMPHKGFSPNNKNLPKDAR